MIKKPTLLIDEKRCKENIKFMFLKAQKHKLIFRPHFKTHQSLEIGHWFKELGIDKITVSSLEMAKYFSKEWDDITVAFPTNILEIDTINELAEKIQLNLLVESKETVIFLKKYLNNPVGIFIKIDVGSYRTGISPADNDAINRILKAFIACDKMHFKGFLAHAGHTYNCRNAKEIVKIHQKAQKILSDLKNSYKQNYPEIINSIGDTPSCSVVDDFTGIDEIRPGNFVFYDLTQYQIGSCTIDQIAVAMACPIVAIHKNRNEMVVYGGGVHFSKERLETEQYGTIFGRIVQKQGRSWGKSIPDMYIKNLSQEHGIISVPDVEIAKYKIGDYILALPVHSCMTADLMRLDKNKSKIITHL